MNWDNGTTPTAVDPAVVDGATPHNPEINGSNASALSLTVGQNSTGSLAIRNGGVLFTGGGSVSVIGSSSGSSGYVSIDGLASAWMDSSDVVVGLRGSGTVEVTNQGTLGTRFLALGRDQTGSGLVIVQGPGSSLHNQFDINLGMSGGGEIDILGGASVSSQNLVMGGSPTGAGQVSISGAGSTLTVTSSIEVGRFGSGAMTISNGGTATANHSTIAGESGSSGTVTVDGAGSSWINADYLQVGSSGSALLDVRNGGLVANGIGVLGVFSGSEGTAMISGAGSRWTNSDALYVGSSGYGALAVLSGGEVTSTNGFVGFNPDGTGSVAVDGTGSHWTLTGNLHVGSGGTGEMLITGGGHVTSVAGWIGFNPGSNGTVTVDGVGSNWASSGDLTVGMNGTGSLTVGDGGIASAGNIYFGRNAGSNGTGVVEGADSLLTASLDLFVGENGHGELTIRDGGQVSNYDGVIGTNAGSSGAVVVTGAGSLWQNNDLFLGLDSGSTGSLEILDGGLVTGQWGYIANRSNTNASALVSGIGSRLDLSRILIVGNHGNGLLEVENGGAVNSLDGSVGHFAGATGAARVSGPGSSWNIGATFDIGRYGRGSVDVDGGGTITTSQFRLGSEATGSGQALIDGAGSNIQASGSSTIGGLGEGTVTVRNGGTFNTGGTLRIADAAGSNGALIVGADSGQAATAPGTVNAGSIQFGAGDGRIVFNHTSSNYTFAGSITGQGNLSFESGTTILTGNSSGFNGQAALNGGTLVVQGSLGQVLAVDIGGRLMGTGTIGGAMLFGTVAPGNSIGTLNFGNASFFAGSTYEVEVTTAGASDLIAATGNITINGGTVRVLNPVGTYALGTRYTIVSTGGNVTGTFSGLSVLNPLQTPFLTFGLSYAPKAVYLDVLRSSVTFASVGQSDNQKATGAGLDSLPQSGTLISALVQLTGPQAAQAFDQLSGEVHASAKTALVEDSRFIRGAMGERMRAEMGEGAYLWGSGYGSWGHTDSDGNAARSGRSIGGALIGYDRSAGENLRLGLLAGWSRSQFDVAARSSAGHANSVHLGLYGNGRWEMGKGELALRAGGAYSWHKLETARQVVFPGFADSLGADYKAGSVQGFAELGYSMKAGKLAFEPYAGLAFVSLRSSGFTEAGGVAALTGHERTDSFTFGSLGLRTTIALGDTGTFRLGTGWRHAFGDTAPLSIHSFGSASQFTVAGSPIGGDQAEVEAGLDFAAGQGVRIGASYGGQFSKGARDHSVRATIGVKF